MLMRRAKKAVHRTIETGSGRTSGACKFVPLTRQRAASCYAISERIGRPRGLLGNSTKPRISVKPSVRPGGRIGPDRAGPGAMHGLCMTIDGYERPLERGLLAPTAAARSGDRSTRHHMVCRDLRAHKHGEGPLNSSRNPRKGLAELRDPNRIASAGAPSSTHAPSPLSRGFAPPVTRRKFVTRSPKLFPENQEQCMRMHRVPGTTGCSFTPKILAFKEKP